MEAKKAMGMIPSKVAELLLVLLLVLHAVEPVPDRVNVPVFVCSIAILFDAVSSFAAVLLQSL